MNSLDIQKWRNKYIYQINESEDDDFNITTDAFDEVELKTGDIITRDMWKDPDWDGQEMGPLEIGDIVAEDGDEFVILAHTEYDYWEEYDLNYVNSMLKHPYKIFFSLDEQYEDDDFNITTDAFDEVEIKPGDHITPKMWNLDNPDLDLYIDDPDEDWVINRFNRSGDVELRTETGGHIITSVESIEDLLKPKYKIVLN